MEKEIIKTDEKTEIYLGSKIVAWIYRWKEFNDEKNIYEDKKEICCHVYRIGSKNQPLNLGQCNDGSKFTSVNQSINQVKAFINCCNEIYK